MPFELLFPMHLPRPAPYLCVLDMSSFVILANFTLASPEKPPKCALRPPRTTRRRDIRSTLGLVFSVGWMDESGL